MAKTKLPISLVRSEKDMMPVEAYNPDEKRGECIYIKGENAMSLPDSGEATITFRVKRREQEMENGKPKYEVKIELLEITKVKSDMPTPPATSGTEAGMALDKLRSEMEV